MSLADLFSAHYMAYVHKIVGNESIYKKDAIRLFHTTGIFKSCTPEKAAEEGFLMNDELAMAIHKKYKDGKYSDGSIVDEAIEVTSKITAKK